MSRFLCVIACSLMLIVGFFTGCSKPSISEEERLEYYELNRQNSLRMFKPFMYNTSEGEQKELFKMVHVSDVHISPWSNSNNIQNPYNLKEAVRFANDTAARINAMVATGDYISNHDKTSRAEAIVYLNTFTNALYYNNNTPTFTSTGNHDVNMLNPDYATNAFSKTDIFNLLTSKINYKIDSDGQVNHYYADLVNPMGGIIRIITLDVTDQENFVYSAQHNAILSQKQIDWLCHTALKKEMTEHHSVIILIHHPLPPDEDEEFKRVIYNAYLYDWNMIPKSSNHSARNRLLRKNIRIS